ncbi:protein RALF-like 34 [Aristolochia californica]|uniref:protein RALF-like 34 n=1 Tax=Aristolochia californica TaxID=171875 RepID=UPI0035D6360B
MAFRLLNLALSLLLVSLILANVAESQLVDSSLQLMGDSLEWQAANSVFDFGDEMEEDDAEEGMSRRSLYWRRHYYISYGALAANRVPCPPRSGRSYYTRNCYRARGPKDFFRYSESLSSSRDYASHGRDQYMLPVPDSDQTDNLQCSSLSTSYSKLSMTPDTGGR